jgi:4-diphosphocytidyl-2-C-methyl-D-erythritol kinase
MLIYSACKINIGLQVYGKREDGYHELESVFFPVPFYDLIEYQVTTKAGRGQIHLHQLNQDYPIPEEEHLIRKAYQFLLKKRNMPSLDVYQYKQIPPGSGLGGGSANAISFLRSVNKQFDLKLSAAEMQELALRLGSDCSFFLQDNPCLVRGRGDQMESIDLPLQHLYLVLLYTGIKISTGHAFAGLEQHKHQHSLKDLLSLPMNKWRIAIRNDFEDQAFEQYPELAIQKELLYGTGALYASMSGSGSCIYGLYEHPPKEKPGKILWHGYLKKNPA